MNICSWSVVCLFIFLVWLFFECAQTFKILMTYNLSLFFLNLWFIFCVLSKLSCRVSSDQSGLSGCVCQETIHSSWPIIKVSSSCTSTSSILASVPHISLVMWWYNWLFLCLFNLPDWEPHVGTVGRLYCILLVPSLSPFRLLLVPSCVHQHPAMYLAQQVHSEC